MSVLLLYTFLGGGAAVVVDPVSNADPPKLRGNDDASVPLRDNDKTVITIRGFDEAIPTIIGKD